MGVGMGWENPRQGTPPLKFNLTLYCTQSSLTSYQWSRGVPEGCTNSGSSHICDIFVGINSNSKDNNMLDFTLEANAKGWVAIGFSKTPNMVKS